MTAPKTGDRVRVVLEGEVRKATDRGFMVVGGAGRFDGNYVARGAPHVVSVERIVPDIPAWWPPRFADVARVFNSTYLRGEDVWTNASGVELTDEDVHIERGRLLVRDGKAV